MLQRPYRRVTWSGTAAERAQPDRRGRSVGWSAHARRPTVEGEPPVQVNAKVFYPASPDVVFEMLVDRAFCERVCEATGAIRYEVEIERDAGAATITTRRELPTDQVPDYARGFIGSSLEVVRVDHWDAPDADGNRDGTVTVEIKGAPIRLNGSLALRVDDAGTQELIAGDLKASIPLLGGKIEKAAEPALMSAIRKEEEVGLQQLGG
jgi:hypothetical protein